MPTFSSAIADATPDPQKPVPQPQLKQKPKRPREFWEVDPGEPGTEGWRDDPDHPTDAQLGSIANTNPKFAIFEPTTLPKAKSGWPLRAD